MSGSRGYLEEAGLSDEKQAGDEGHPGRTRWAALEIGSPPQVAAGVVLLTGFVVALWWGLERLGVDRVERLVDQAGALGPVLYIAMKASTYIIAPLSGGPFQIVSGVLFGFWTGTAYTLIADTIGGTVNFWISRRFGKRLVARLAGTKGIETVETVYQRLGGWRGLFAARFVLSPIYDFVCYAAGLTTIPYRAFAIVTIAGGFVPIALFVALGASLVENKARLFVAYLVVVALSAVPLLLRSRRSPEGRRDR